MIPVLREDSHYLVYQFAWANLANTRFSIEVLDKSITIKNIIDEHTGALLKPVNWLINLETGKLKYDVNLAYIDTLNKDTYGEFLINSLQSLFNFLNLSSSMKSYQYIYLFSVVMFLLKHSYIFFFIYSIFVYSSSILILIFVIFFFSFFSFVPKIINSILFGVITLIRVLGFNKYFSSSLILIFKNFRFSFSEFRKEFNKLSLSLRYHKFFLKDELKTSLKDYYLYLTDCIVFEIYLHKRTMMLLLFFDISCRKIFY